MALLQQKTVRVQRANHRVTGRTPQTSCRMETSQRKVSEGHFPSRGGGGGGRGTTATLDTQLEIRIMANLKINNLGRTAIPLR